MRLCVGHDVIDVGFIQTVAFLLGFGRDGSLDVAVHHAAEQDPQTTLLQVGVRRIGCCVP